MTTKTYTKADYLQQWGHPTSVGIFDSASQLFSVPGIEGVIGYRWQSKNAVVLGDPLCPENNLLPLTKAFADYCKSHGKKVIYVATSEHFAEWARNNARISSCGIEIGSEILLNPMNDPLAGTGKNASRLRNKHSLALRDGLSMKEYIGHDPVLEQALEEVATLWQQNRTGPQMYFSDLSILSDRTYKRYFYVEQEGIILGLLILNRIDSYQGWFINILMLRPDAHNSTSEFIMLEALKVLRAEECTHLSVGVNSGNELGKLYGFNRLSSWIARKMYHGICAVFKLDSRERYWNKFNPVKKPSFVLFQSRVGLRDGLDILYALNIKKKNKDA